MKHCKLLLSLILVAIFACSLSFYSNAQNQSRKAVYVIVKDALGGLTGANVVVKGTTIGANTDTNGIVNLPNVPSNATLVISCMGYKTQEVSVAGTNSLEIFLEEDTNMLDELVVIGYGTVKKRDLTGAVSQVKSKDMTAYTVSNPIQALQGRVPGLNLTTNTGSPEGNFSIRIRGANSIRGDNDPLYIIDGMPASVRSINSYDIESVEILKDASATAIYGSRGANGVILITTKNGRAGRTQVNYNFEYGVQSIRKTFDVLDASDWMRLVNLQQINDKGKAYFSDSDIANAGAGFDWQDAVYRTAAVKNHNISVQGGNDKTRFVVSGSALSRDGIIRNSGFKKYNLRSSIDHDINKYWNFQLKMGYSFTDVLSKASSDKTSRGSSIVNVAITAPPTLTPFNEDGSYTDLRLAYPFMGNSFVNPINEMDATTSKAEANLIDLNAAITFKPFKGFSIKSSWGMESYDYRSDSYTNSKILYGGTSASVKFNRSNTLVNENIANYNVTIAHDHSINLMGGFTYQQHVAKELGGSGTGYLADITETYDLGAATTPGIPSSGYSKWVLMSFLARFNYAYKGKYLLTLSARADGSSRYSPGNKWGYFPSGAIAWRVSEEPWLKNNPTISDLKIRAGYGVTGSTAISPYATMNVLSSGTGPLDNKNTGVYFAPSSTFPGVLKWESTAQYDVGIDLALFNNRLRFTADAYYKLTSDLLNSVNLPRSSGYTSQIQNIGKMSNRGLEFLLEGEIISTKDWSWTASGNISINRNRIEELAAGKDIFGSSMGTSFFSGTVNLLREKEPMGVFYVYKFDGWSEDGKFTYVDIDESGSINESDRMILGNPNPKFIGGFSSELRWKNLSLSMFWQGSYGNDLYNITGATFFDYGIGLNSIHEVLNSHWDANNTAEQNALAKYPKPTDSGKLNVKQSDYFIEDGSYLRLKNIQLSYSIPFKWDWIQRLNLYVSAQNLLTFTNYSGLDPEVNAYGSDSTLGIDFNGYPMTKTISFGANITF